MESGLILCQRVQQSHGSDFAFVNGEVTKKTSLILPDKPWDKPWDLDGFGVDFGVPMRQPHASHVPPTNWSHPAEAKGPVDETLVVKLWDSCKTSQALHAVEQKEAIISNQEEKMKRKDEHDENMLL
jgi:hypothetical protein